MSTQESFSNTSKFGPGPWQSEPDKVEWLSRGFPCLALRGPLGNWCGYVGVPPGHPWHGKGYDDVDAEVHGGLTYSAPCDGGRICHEAAPGEPEPWWQGFDCAHGGDLVPRFETRGNGLVRTGNVYRDLAYVTAEVESLAEQAEEAARGL